MLKLVAPVNVVWGLSHLHLSWTVLLVARIHELSRAVERWLLDRDTLKVMYPCSLSLIRCLRLYLDGWKLPCFLLTKDSSRLPDRRQLALIEVLLFLPMFGYDWFEFARLDTIGLHLMDTGAIKYATKSGWLVVGASDDCQVALTRGSNYLILW